MIDVEKLHQNMAETIKNVAPDIPVFIDGETENNEELREFVCENGIVYKCHPKCCLFCQHCADVFYDYTNGPYMTLCELNLDEDTGREGNCARFLDVDASGKEG